MSKTPRLGTRCHGSLGLAVVFIGLIGCGHAGNGPSGPETRAEARSVARQLLEDAERSGPCQALFRQAASITDRKRQIEMMTRSYGSGAGSFGITNAFTRMTGADDAANFAANVAAQRDLDRLEQQRRSLIQLASQRVLAIARENATKSQRSLLRRGFPEFLDTSANRATVDRLLNEV